MSTFINQSKQLGQFEAESRGQFGAESRGQFEAEFTLNRYTIAIKYNKSGF